MTEFNNDVARVAVREPGATGWREEHMMQFRGSLVTHLWAGRTQVSHHNSSSPDMAVMEFRGE